MKWFAIISCISSHTWSGMLFCHTAKDTEIERAWETEEDCVKWAESWLNAKYNAHLGQFEWGYKCVLKSVPQPYKPKRL